MNSAPLRILLPASALLALAGAPAAAQRPPSPEQRIAILEQQVAASRASAIRLEQRLDSIERQLQQLINQGEVGGQRVSELEAALAKLRSDFDARLAVLETRPVPPQGAQADPGDAEPFSSTPPRRAVAESAKPKPPAPAESAKPKSPAPVESAVSDPGEDAYSEGFRLWRDGKYDQAITALRAFTSAFPKHRRVSFANNLVGRALLDKGQPRAAAEALLANYRSNPKGERAADSLYYLGQALMRLNQAAQACKAYAELEDVYGASVRPDLSALVNKGKADAGCS